MQIVVNELLLSLIAGMGCLVGSTLFLPSLATDELREGLAGAIQICGMSISGYASRIFPPEQVRPALQHLLNNAGLAVHSTMRCKSRYREAADETTCGQ